MSNKKPVNVKITGENIDIEFVTESVINGLCADDYAYGWFDSKAIKIYINKETHIDRQKAALWHEIGEAIESQIDIRDKPYTHTLMDIQKMIEFQVMKDNPKVMEWIMS